MKNAMFYFTAGMGFVYIAVGIYLLIMNDINGFFTGITKTISGILFILYGIYRIAKSVMERNREKMQDKYYERRKE